MRSVLAVAVSLCLAAPALAASKRPATKVIDGETVAFRRPLAGEPIVQVTKLRFYDCILERTKAPCTVVRGELRSHLPTADFVVKLVFEFHDKHLRRGTFHKMGTATVEVVRPEPGRPARFYALGPDVIRSRDMESAPAAFSGYTLSVQVLPFRPKVNR